MADILARGQRGALATVVRTDGSTPQRPGARMLLCPDGRVLGTVGGGLLEQRVLQSLHACVAEAGPELVVHALGHDEAVCCGGRTEVFVEPVEAEPRLRLCGAGHVAAATAPLLCAVGFEVTVVDARASLNTEARFPGCARELRAPDDWLAAQGLEGRDWLLIATHDHALDERVLEGALAQAPRYIGMIGSKRKVLRLLDRIASRRGPQPLANVYAPVGLALGAVGPQEIAVSIVAELVALRRGVSAPHLRLTRDEDPQQAASPDTPLQARR